MSSIAQIEANIQNLQEKEFFDLLGWMTERHLEVLSAGEFEAPELEAEVLKSVGSKRHQLSEALLDVIRTQGRNAGQ